MDQDSMAIGIDNGKRPAHHQKCVAVLSTVNKILINLNQKNLIYLFEDLLPVLENMG